MDSKSHDALAQLLREAGSAHHKAFIHVNGEDAEWPAWYAHWLAARVEGWLHIAEAELAVVLDELERQRNARSPAPDWPRFYAGELIRRFA